MEKYYIETIKTMDTEYDDETGITTFVEKHKFVVHDRETEYPLMEFDHYCEAQKYCNDNDPDTIY